MAAAASRRRPAEQANGRPSVQSDSGSYKKPGVQPAEQSDLALPDFSMPEFYYCNLADRFV